jgi:hypothetical protein
MLKSNATFQGLPIHSFLDKSKVKVWLAKLSRLNALVNTATHDQQTAIRGLFVANPRQQITSYHCQISDQMPLSQPFEFLGSRLLSNSRARMRIRRFLWFLSDNLRWSSGHSENRPSGGANDRWRSGLVPGLRQATTPRTGDRDEPAIHGFSLNSILDSRGQDGLMAWWIDGFEALDSCRARYTRFIIQESRGPRSHRPVTGFFPVRHTETREKCGGGSLSPDGRMAQVPR